MRTLFNGLVALPSYGMNQWPEGSMRGMKTQALGDIRIDRIVEFETPIFSPISFFDEATPEALAPHRHWLEPRASRQQKTNPICE